MTESEGVLELHAIHRSYGRGEEVLAGVSLSIGMGQVVGLLGRNGAGKTTLIHIAMGMLRPQHGSVRVFGIDPFVHPVEVKRRIGFVAEEQVLPPQMRAGAVLDFHRELFPSWDTELEETLRRRFTFKDRARVRSLSKGQARQLALVCAVAHRPELLILDEPAGGLDPAARREFLETSIELLTDGGTTILFSSHYMTDVERLADRIVLLHDREILIDRPIDELRERYALVVVPATAGVGAAAFTALPGCLRVREHRGTLRAVFEGTAAAIRAELEHEPELAGASCRHPPLEELFVDLLGADS